VAHACEHKFCILSHCLFPLKSFLSTYVCEYEDGLVYQASVVSFDSDIVVGVLILRLLLRLLFRRADRLQPLVHMQNDGFVLSNVDEGL